jgi:L-glutamine:scyllo-inosose aminotransferase/L-glutamine:2-deoxy-scyllo-inosose/3-amino-2,3-dideoxy-scyllo-inosose aminotransferase
VIEDCAHSRGSKWDGHGAGTISHFGSFSLQSSKTLTSGEGRILLCKSAEHAALAASIIDCGRPHALGGGGEDSNGLAVQGCNYRLSEVQAALALVGIERFPEQAKQREAEVETGGAECLP